MQRPITLPSGLALGGLPHNRVGAQAIAGQQHDPRAPHMFLKVRSAIIASRRERSAAFTSTMISVCIPQNRITASAREPAFGLFRQINPLECQLVSDCCNEVRSQPFVSIDW